MTGAGMVEISRKKDYTSMKKYDLITFGEIIMRLSPSDEGRISNARSFDSYIGGAELNVASVVAGLGLKSAHISKVPAGPMSELVRRNVLSCKVSDELIVEDMSNQARLGLYYYEQAYSPRKPQVVYDRRNSSFCSMSIDELPEEIFDLCRCFHVSGIDLALGERPRELAIALMKKFREHGAKISFDVNFRGNLWTGSEAKECIEQILPLVDIFFCGEDTARLTFLKTGTAKEIMKSFTEEYSISVVCSTKRIVHSPKKHSFSAIIYNKADDSFVEEAPYENIQVADRIGSGDAFVGGALYGILNDELDLSDAVAYGTACGALKNTIYGDLLNTSLEEVQSVIKDHKSGSFSEMKR